MTEHRLSIPGRIEQVPHACGWVVGIAEAAGLGMREVNHCELAIDEAVTNIVEHGYGADGGDKVIDIIIKEKQDRLEITIVDNGPPFNPLRLENPDPLASLDERAENGGGWGIFFIKKLMDNVDYKYTADRNHLVMIKKKEETQ
jgi:serine/threonine-protein kinase RsbW